LSAGRSANPFIIFGLWLLSLAIVPAALAAGSGFSPQQRVGYSAGDQWEPSIAADGAGSVYVLYPQYGQVPGCADCRIPSMVLVLSNDNGATWQPPREISPAPSGQFDPQIVVDPADRHTVYASWLQNDKRDLVLAKSLDAGLTWSVMVAHSTQFDIDKPVLAARGPNVYIGFNHRQTLWVAASHDAGMTFSVAEVSPNTRLAWSQAGGATVDISGNVFFSWAAYSKSAGAKGPVTLYVSKSTDGGPKWTTRLLDVSGAPPECASAECDSDFLSAQITMTSDAAGTLYALWNAGVKDKGAQRIYFSSSTTSGANWARKIDVSAAPKGVEHSFPAIAAGAAGDVRIAWMDARHSLWNTFYRSSTNGGASWSPETQLSSYVPGYNYIQPRGFSFPFGDYFGIAIDNRGDAQVVWGEGMNYQAPGSIWYTTGR